MYGLFKYMYDYHEWEELICVSKYQKLLIDHAYQFYDGDVLLVYSEEEHETLKDKGFTHLMIKEVIELCQTNK